MLSEAEEALYPYKITLLSNAENKRCDERFALHPYKITLLSNDRKTGEPMEDALYPYKITLLSNLKYLIKTAYEPVV